jgi:hypothetical protein
MRNGVNFLRFSASPFHRFNFCPSRPADLPTSRFADKLDL